ncbi:hypothetical protein [Nonomuraea rhodomycinica]|uniref:Uncharacterized protein n=1 Tax=Nonomuraea rhodomycinica TaxID=1712872 RepID=A0A7Y6IRI0_9ACTN|nr:hypothetical protein [Nonomuraea rhodomycinica]NUW42748.1 hypothetical protein [Nonomuraea rhodomycinica]
MPERKHPRPAGTRAIAERLKLHRHHVRADGRDYTVITLRPGTRARFSTNHHHQTWHILSDPHGALLLSRLLWGLSFQRRPGTVVLLDRRFIGPNPFDADPGDPIALVPALLTHLPARTARALSRRVTEPGSQSGTVLWRTWGLAAAVEAWHGRYADPDWSRTSRARDDERAADVRHLGGVLSLRAAPSLLRRWAVYTATMGEDVWHGMSYTELDSTGGWRTCRGEGEVQTFLDYHRRVSVARVSRREVLASGDAPAEPADLRPLVWARNDAVLSRRLPGETRPTRAGPVGRSRR